jgi:hypothetical protein
VGGTTLQSAKSAVKTQHAFALIALARSLDVGGGGDGVGAGGGGQGQENDCSGKGSAGARASETSAITGTISQIGQDGEQGKAGGKAAMNDEKGKAAVVAEAQEGVGGMRRGAVQKEKTDGVWKRGGGIKVVTNDYTETLGGILVCVHLCVCVCMYKYICI